MVVRHDLSAGAQTVQSCHALAALTARHPDVADLPLVAAALPDLATLEAAWEGLVVSGAGPVRFDEPDLCGLTTAIATTAGRRELRLLRKLPGWTLVDGSSADPDAVGRETQLRGLLRAHQPTVTAALDARPVACPAATRARAAAVLTELLDRGLVTPPVLAGPPPAHHDP